MTAQDLKRLDELAATVDELQKRLTALRNAILSLMDNFPSEEEKSDISDLMGCIAILKENPEKKIHDSTLEMVEIIDTIKSEKTRKIFRGVYVYRKNWGEIADDLGYESESGARARMRRYKKRLFGTSQSGINAIKYT